MGHGSVMPSHEVLHDQPWVYHGFDMAYHEGHQPLSYVLMISMIGDGSVIAYHEVHHELLRARIVKLSMTCPGSWPVVAKPRHVMAWPWQANPEPWYRLGLPWQCHGNPWRHRSPLMATPWRYHAYAMVMA